uniref:Coatomer subunit delta n=1 Tax=Albugo laibachii Nc14 TaxID=890382 RepID=F0W1Q2_9STRA|nr:coatomer subunit delta putative [Albugo laibachii Nc14]|eukprot:CCA14981.1 coatomer subunit delta putative [Albugo laibachii Nc14]
MVVLSAALLTRNGKVLVARQFVEITRIRIEGLLTAFPKLLSTGQREHTFIDTESVRYVYQPLENYFVLLITNKTSNIMEDLHTIQILAKLIPDICGSLSESAVREKQFELVFGFDELISAGGHSENITLQQIRINMEMESHEEKLQNMILESKRAAAKDDMKRHTIRIKEEQRERARLERAGLSSAYNQNSFGSGFGSDSPRATGGMGSREVEYSEITRYETWRISLEKAVPTAPVEAVAVPQPQVVVSKDPVGVVVEEKIAVQLTREGQLEQLEIKGSLFVTVNDPVSGRCRLRLRALPPNEIALQTHPKVDKKLFDQDGILGLKDSSKPFPSTRVGVLRWGFKTQDESYSPLNITCWPEEESGGKINVSMEYSMDRSEMKLENVDILIPLGSSEMPQIAHIDGQYRHKPSDGALLWHLDCIESSNSSGTLEFSIHGSNMDGFFPVSISFFSRNVYCDVQVEAVFLAEDHSSNIAFGFDKLLSTESYQIA